jgi:hypothetical protein
MEPLQQKLDEVTQTMRENVQFAVQNTEKVENLQQKSELLKTSSHAFSEKASALRRIHCGAYWKRNVTVLLVVLFLLILLILLTQH